MSKKSIQTKIAESINELAEAEKSALLSAPDMDEASLALHNALALCEAFHAVEHLEDDVIVSLAVMQWAYLRQAKDIIDGSRRA